MARGWPIRGQRSSGQYQLLLRRYRISPQHATLWRFAPALPAGNCVPRLPGTVKVSAREENHVHARSAGRLVDPAVAALRAQIRPRRLVLVHRHRLLLRAGARRVSPWPEVTAILWAVIAFTGLWLGLLGIAMATGLAIVLNSGEEIAEDYWRSIIDYPTAQPSRRDSGLPRVVDLPVLDAVEPSRTEAARAWKSV